MPGSMDEWSDTGALALMAVGVAILAGFSAPYAEEVKWLISSDMGMRHCLADGVTAVDLG